MVTNSNGTTNSNGFILNRIDGVVSVFPSQKFQLQTTNSWNFVGLPRGVERHAGVESDIIVGVIDTGIWPESESFNDEGFGPVPTTWKGECNGGTDFVCNKKLIGARAFSVASSPRDIAGHGTHCASIIAGNEVIDMSYYGFAKGVARGGVPSARIAAYKVCDLECEGMDILAAFDQATADGVNIISISIGFPDAVELAHDPIAIGSFHALEKGILTVNAAGNEGPDLSSITNYAPWVLIVGASDTNRSIVGRLLLGSGEVLVGHAINPFPSSDELLPLIYGIKGTSNCSETEARKCLPQCLETSLVKNKVLLCDLDINIEAVKASGALGCILQSSIKSNFSAVMPFPVIALNTDSLESLKSYINQDTAPKVKILRSETIMNQGAPFVASFSSRGPSRYLTDIIKPDVVAPGVEILAAFSPKASPSGFDWDKNSTKFNILSGTSMACPHVAAAAAFVKSFHPDWSPSAIKSALMTTASELSASLHPQREFAYGSGQIVPLDATRPGLVLKIWCNTSRTLGRAIQTNTSCQMALMPKDINYPSMMVQLDYKNRFSVSFNRTVTNVGYANSTYVSSIEGDHSGLDIRVEPSTLIFKALKQKREFVVTVSGMSPSSLQHVSLVWTDGVHRVRSPIVIHTMGTSDGTRKLSPSRFYIVSAILMINSIAY